MASSEEIYHTLRGEILSLTLRPGQPIAESELARRFSVSRTPVRAALSRLKSEKLVEVFPQKGTFVAPVDWDFVRQLIYMRCSVELRLADQLCADPPEEMLRELRRNLNSQLRLLQAGGNPMDYYQIDSSFHRICFTHCGMEAVWRIFRQFHANYTRFRLMDIRESGLTGQFYEEHCRMVQLMEEGKPKELKALIQQHLESGFQRMAEKAAREAREQTAT